jgi:hypothetical protein
VRQGFIRVVLAACVAALALPVATAGGGEKFFKVRVAKQESGPYSVFQKVHIPVGEAKSAYFKVKNKANENLLHMNFNDNSPDPNPEDYNVRWFKGDNDISSQVKSEDGYPFTLKQDKPLIIRVKVKHLDPGDGACVDGEAAGDDVGDSIAVLGVNTLCTL